MKLKYPIFFLALAVTTACSVYFFTKSNSLNKQLKDSKEQQEVAVSKLMEYEKLAQLDSILLEGDYDTAIKSYSENLSAEKENKMRIPLRIALAEKLAKVQRSPSRKEDSLKAALDSLPNQQLTSSEELRRYDSINFTLEKTRVQLARLKSQFQNKAYGEYLKFKSKKGNFMHYVGQVKNGKANGFGIAVLDSGSRYEGEWKDNERQGEGTFYWPDGEYYVGTYQNDKRSGFGTYYWPNGEKYTGQWKEDKRSGNGQFFDADGDLVAGGEWSEDKLVEINDR
ncbi:MORN repeat-containing protein [Euzebyella saccharophila]|uniref:MORN repeat-containing protein n=1 Tax=Euzebyella saccharophila TaxID=679664 RepID=A0ABV8JRK3_9FLAO|nr:hypothetical protein [Euzebyella saccharophila]